MKTTSRALQNGLIFIEDIGGGEPPSTITGEKIRFTPSCISVSCLNEIDGETELILGPASEVAPGFDVAFDGTLETPSRELMLSTVPGDILLQTAVPTSVTRIRVWRNHPNWADKVVVGWG